MWGSAFELTAYAWGTHYVRYVYVCLFMYVC